MVSTGLNCIPVCLLGVDKRSGGLGIGLVDEILDTRAFLKREKKAYFCVVAVSDGVGSISPRERFPIDTVLIDNGGIPDEHLMQVVSVKKQGNNLDVESYYEEGLSGVLKQSIQPGMVIVDQMKQEFDDVTLKALESVASLGCSLVIPTPKSSEYKNRCKELFGDNLITFSKPPSIRKLLFTILDSFEKNPRKHDDIDLELVKVIKSAENGHHVHHDGCNHDHDHDEEALKHQQKIEEIMKLIAKDPARALPAIKKGNLIFLNAMVALCSMRKEIPDEFKSPKIPDGSGYTAFFVENGAMEKLIQHTMSSAKDFFRFNGQRDLKEIQKMMLMFNILRNMLKYDGVEVDMVYDKFLALGGVEILRGATRADIEKSEDGKIFRYPGMLRIMDYDLRTMALDILESLQIENYYLRKCDYCGVRETKIAEWKQCAKCG